MDLSASLKHIINLGGFTDTSIKEPFFLAMFPRLPEILLPNTSLAAFAGFFRISFSPNTRNSDPL